MAGPYFWSEPATQNNFVSEGMKMLAALSIERRLDERMTAIDLSVSNLAALSDLCRYPISQSRLSVALAGTKDLSNDQGKALDALLGEIEKLVESAQPYPVSLKNPQLVRPLLLARREGKLTMQDEIKKINKRLDIIEKTLRNENIRLVPDDDEQEFKKLAAEIYRQTHSNVTEDK
jgi:hypothetical protein